MAMDTNARLRRLRGPGTANGDATADPTAADASPSSVAAVALTESHSRERIAGSPLVPDGVRWAEDGRVAVVSEASIMISTFMSRELEMYIQHAPPISKSFIFVPDSAQIGHERVPLKIPVFSEPTDGRLPAGSLTYFLLNEKNRHQYNPKELSLSKNDGTAFLAATWGPRGSGPNSSCAMLALTSSSRISLHFSSSFHLSWKEVAVFSENLFEFMDSRQWTLQIAEPTTSTPLTTPSKDATDHDNGRDTPASGKKKAGKAKTMVGYSKKRKRASVGAGDASTISMTEYARRSGLVSTLSVAWSPFVTNAEQHTTSLIAFCGRVVTTVWGYDYPSFEAFSAAETSTAPAVSNSTDASSPFLSSTPFVWLDTEKHGWISTSTWQQMHRSPGKATSELRLAMGTAEGKVLLANIPVMPRDMHVSEVPIDRVILAPHLQPVYGIRLGARNTYTNSERNDLVVASGSRISVWNINKKRAQPMSWKAHTGNVTGLDVDYFGEKIFSCGVDGKIRLWETETAKEIPFVASSSKDSDDTAAMQSDSQPAHPRYPMFGLSVSPNSAQVACMYVIPPAARPNRKSQADVSYSRVSTSLEYLPTPYASHASEFVQTMCNILKQGRDMSTMADVLWLCHEDNAAITSLQGTADLTLPHLLNKLKGVSGGRNGEEARQPLYLSLCGELEKRYYESIVAASSDEADKVPLFLQASFLLRSCVTPAEHHVSIRDEALPKIKRTLYVFWAERCLKELLASHSQVQNFADISKTERISALLMADFLSVQQPMSTTSERLVTTIYNRLGSEENIARWAAYLKERVDYAAQARRDTTREDTTASAAEVPVPPVPPPRQTCFICEEAVPFGELDQFCSSGHVQDRCFLSFQVLSSMDTWKCMGCGASACEIDFSHGRSPFYLLESQSKALAKISSTSTMQIVCRLCGNYCSFLRY